MATLFDLDDIKPGQATISHEWFNVIKRYLQNLYRPNFSLGGRTLNTSLGPLAYPEAAVGAAAFRWGKITKVYNKYGVHPGAPYEEYPMHSYSGFYLDDFSTFDGLVTMQSRDPNTQYWWHLEGTAVLISTFTDMDADSDGKPIRSSAKQKTVIISPEPTLSTLETCPNQVY